MLNTVYFNIWKIWGVPSSQYLVNKVHSYMFHKNQFYNFFNNLILHIFSIFSYEQINYFIFFSNFRQVWVYLSRILIKKRRTTQFMVKSQLIITNMYFFFVQENALHVGTTQQGLTVIDVLMDMWIWGRLTITPVVYLQILQVSLYIFCIIGSSK